MFLRVFTHMFGSTTVYMHTCIYILFSSDILEAFAKNFIVFVLSFKVLFDSNRPCLMIIFFTELILFIIISLIITYVKMSKVFTSICAFKLSLFQLCIYGLIFVLRLFSFIYNPSFIFKK